MPGLSHNSQFFAIPYETLHFSQKCLQDRLLLSTENIVSKKVNFIFHLIFSDQISESWDFHKHHEGLFIWSFSIGCSNQRITTTKFQTKSFFRTCFLSFFHFFNERILVVQQISYNVLHLIYWCRNFSIHKNFKAVIVWRNRLNLRPETLSSSSTLPDKSGESQSRETTGLLLFP